MIDRTAALELISEIRDEIDKLMQDQDYYEDKYASLDDDADRYHFTQRLHWVKLSLAAARKEEARLFTHLTLSMFQDGSLSFRHADFQAGCDIEGKLTVVLDWGTILTFNVMISPDSESLRATRPPYELTEEHAAYVSAGKLENVDDLREALLAWTESTLGRRDVKFTEWY